jgi:polyhydroxyalkanoate synthesis repressor PhaR
MLDKTEPQADRKSAVVIKKYANRRLYNTETSTYVTLEDLAKMVRSDRDFVVFDAKTGDDLTHSVLTQIIVEQESKSDGPTLLPIPFLRQLIRFYDDSVAKMVPPYLQMSLEALVKEQERFRTQFSPSWQPASAFDAYQEQARKNIAMFEQAMKMWSPFGPSGTAPFGSTGPEMQSRRAEADAAEVKAQAADAASTAAAPPAATATSAPAPAAAAPKPPAPPRDEIAELRAQLEAMQAKIEKLSPRG